jgi:RsiW-degrading membrane proteinase PrsW (M82 family)
MILALGAAAIVPGLFLMWFFHAMDVYEEPKRVLWATFGLGILTIPFVLLAVWPVSAFTGIDEVASPYVRGTLDAFFEAAIPEELFKFAVLMLYAYRHRAFDEPMDGVVYGAAASLGFATLENVLYVGGGGLGTAMLRALTAVPGHACSGVIMGYFVGRAKFRPATRGRLLVAGLFWPMLLHGLYDAPLLILKAFDDVKPPGAVIAVLILAWLVAFSFEVMWAMRLAIRLRDAQLEHMMLGPAATGIPASRPAARLPGRPSRLRGWVQIAVGVLAGGLGGLMTLGLGLVLLAGEIDKGELTGLFIATLMGGLLPLALGALSFRLGIRNLNRAPQPPGAPLRAATPLR